VIEASFVPKAAQSTANRRSHGCFQQEPFQKVTFVLLLGFNDFYFSNRNLPERSLGAEE
jgi:hypothetical protein